MKTLTYNQLKKWNPCNGHDWLKEFEERFGKSAPMLLIEKDLIKREELSALNWIIGKRLEKLNKRQVCTFSYRCAHRSLKYARKQDVEVLEKAISFAKIFAQTGKVDDSAVSAASAAESAAWSARSTAMSAARSAAASAEYKWQFEQLLEIEENFKKIIKNL